jgi:eukaryotic-like serine/threonine-protein kinase
VGKESAGSRVVGGRYHLLREVGEGGMAIVWRAEMRGAAGFARPVAVKKMKAELLRGQVYAAMFVEEARVGAELAHPNIVQIFDFCQDSDGLYCLIMEWVEGLDLRAFAGFHRQHKRPIPWPLVAAMGVGALRGLAAAHERISPTGAPAPVIHRDVSPSNILLGINGVVKLADFGLARARDRVHSLTAPGIVKGKVGYLAPETLRGDPVSIHSDIFCMGIVLWEALAGRPLYAGATDADVLRKVQRAEVGRLDHERRDLPKRLTQIVHQALAPDPARRFPSAGAMAQALASVLAAAPVPADTHPLLGQAVTHVRTHLPPRTPGEKSESEVLLSLTDLDPG